MLFRVSILDEDSGDSEYVSHKQLINRGIVVSILDEDSGDSEGIATLAQFKRCCQVSILDEDSGDSELRNFGKSTQGSSCFNPR